MEVDTQTLEFILGLKKITNIGSLMQKKVKQYNIHEKGVITTTKKDISKIVERLNSSKYKDTPPLDLYKNKECWFWGEQKLFIWIAIYYAQALYIETHSLEKDHFQTIYQLFPLKDQKFLQYEFVSTFGEDKFNQQSWCPEQLAFLANIMQKQEFKCHWKRISYEIFVQSNGKYFKSRQCCRNRWYNHIDPNINKKQWTLDEDQKMIQFMMKRGARWSLIARTVCFGRNEHMTKNRYRSLIKKFKISQKKTIRAACSELLQQFEILKAKNQQNPDKCVKIEEESQSLQNIEEQQSVKEENFEKISEEEQQRQVKEEDINQKNNPCLSTYSTQYVNPQIQLSKIFPFMNYIGYLGKRQEENANPSKSSEKQDNLIKKEEDY